jgi:hypothetical protein
MDDVDRPRRRKLVLTDTEHRVDLFIRGSKLAGVLQSMICSARPIGTKSFVVDGVAYHVHIDDTPAIVTGQGQHVEVDHVADPLLKKKEG